MQKEKEKKIVLHYLVKYVELFKIGMFMIWLLELWASILNQSGKKNWVSWLLSLI